MQSLQQPIETLQEYLAQGGFVMYPLLTFTLLLWYMMGYRFLTLQRGSVRSVRALMRKYEEGELKNPNGIVDTAVVTANELAKRYPSDLRNALDDAFADFEREVRKGRVLILSVVVAAPLLGLLGTVTGMIETFESLGEMAMYTQGGGIAGGISEALFTTQMGLIVAVPGVVIGRMLDRRQEQIEGDLAKVKDLACANAAELGRAS